MNRVLSLCGGGTSGYMTASILSYLEKDSGRNCNDIFDMIVGVSTGSIIGGAIRCGVPAFDIKQLYKDVYRDIFGNKKYLKVVFGSMYDNRVLGDSIEKYIGGIKLKNIKKDFMCYAVCLNSPLLETRFFKSWEPKYGDIPLYKLLSASSSAPLMFDPTQINDEYFYDGGLSMNNPALCSYSQAKRKYDTNNNVVLDIQTDKHGGYKEPETIKGLLKLGLEFPKLSIDSAEGTIQYICETLLEDLYCAVSPQVYLALDSNDWSLMDEVAYSTWIKEKENIYNLLRLD